MHPAMSLTVCVSNAAAAGMGGSRLDACEEPKEGNLLPRPHEVEDA